jgi:hypothetical protein
LDIKKPEKLVLNGFSGSYRFALNPNLVLATGLEPVTPCMSCSFLYATHNNNSHLTTNIKYNTLVYNVLCRYCCGVVVVICCPLRVVINTICATLVRQKIGFGVRHDFSFTKNNKCSG